ncbi:hypothetical protein [Halohasta salina]|uniref:hypothetical protein n=1 Tax=Halohasta salina TaxID=2961621 RepID=UPI0020A59CA0|nr:hypothetical protein [Halohasta salina]
MRRDVVVVAIFVLVGSLAVLPAVGAAAPADEIRLTTTVDRAPDHPGEIAATVSFRLPDRVTELSPELPEGATVTGTDGFSSSNGGDYSWDGRTDSPSITFRVDADQMTDDEGPLAEDGQYLFTATDEWALVRIPSVGVGWTQTGREELTVDRETAVDGPGVAGDRMAYLGEYSVVRRTAHGQTFHLVIPEAAELAESPEAILDSVSHASDALRVGDRDREVLVIAAPTDGVDWGVRGLQTGDAELWVQDSERLDTPTNVWIHEYVHTRQAFANRTAADTRWLTEATATYYAALLTLEDDRIAFDEFRRALELGAKAPQSTSTLSRPDSWQADANYGKGSLVVGELDRRMRLSTDGEASFGTVFGSLNRNGEELTADEFEAAVASASTQSVGTAAGDYTRTDATPAVWSAADHAAAFGQSPAGFAFRLANASITVAGGDRTEPLNRTDPRIAAGETLAVEVDVENVGGTVGDYELPFGVDNRTSTERGRLAPGETASHRFTHTFDDPGRYTVVAGDDRIDLRVEAAESEPPIPDPSDEPIAVDTPGFGVIPAVSVLLLISLAARRLAD